MSLNYYKKGKDVSSIDNLKAHPLADLLPMIDEEAFRKLKDQVEAYGVLEPIILLDGMILDGRNRYKAACELGIDCPTRTVTDVSPFDIVDILNIHRRHLTASQIAMFYTGALELEEMKARERQGTRNDLKRNIRANLPESEEPPNLLKAFIEKIKAEKGKAAEIAAKKAGVGARTMHDAKTVKTKGTPEQVKAVVDGKAAVSSVAKEIRATEKVAKNDKQMNRTNDNIGWAQYSWNPVTGCKFGCPYCYAKEIHDRYFAKQCAFDNPQFHADRMQMPANTKPKANDLNNRVFVCSMGELFGDWVKQEWIDQVIDVCNVNRQWTFLFLTKNPNRLPSIQFPCNSWIGSTIDCQKREQQVAESFAQIENTTRFVSCEPLLERVTLSEKLLSNLELLIVGAKSLGATKEQPPAEWVEHLIWQAREYNVALWLKDNLVYRPQETP